MRRPVVKICGLRTREDVAMCSRHGADILGFVTEYPAPVPWNLDRWEALALLRSAPPSCETCVVTGGSARKITELAAALRPGYVQLHYKETLDETRTIAKELKGLGIKVIKNISEGTADIEGCVRALCDSDIFGILVDPRGPSDAARSGAADAGFFTLVRSASSKPVILAGGINPENVEAILRSTGAEYIDVLSGTEGAPGVKDESMVSALLAAVSR